MRKLIISAITVLAVMQLSGCMMAGGTATGKQRPKTEKAVKKQKKQKEVKTVKKKKDKLPAGKTDATTGASRQVR